MGEIIDIRTGDPIRHRPCKACVILTGTPGDLHVRVNWSADKGVTHDFTDDAKGRRYAQGVASQNGWRLIDLTDSDGEAA